MYVENQTNPDKEETFCALGTFVILQLKYDSMQKNVKLNWGLLRLH